MKIILVIPTYNEKENIEKLLRLIFLLGIANLSVIVVDDASPDGTANIVKKLQKKFPIHLIERKGKLGLGSAYITGFHSALEQHATYIFEMDADLSHDPDDISKLIGAMKHADLAIGSRKIPGGKIIGWSWTRKFMSAGAMWLSKLLLGLKASDVTSGFRCYHRSVLEKIDLSTIRSNGYAFQEELLYRTQKKGFRIIEVPVTFVDRQEGKSKLSKKDIIDFFLTMIRLRFGR